jgi:F420-non-reducing hydrogenase iron-sulfur subunit
MDSAQIDFEPEIVVFYCQNCVQKDVALADSIRRLEGILTRFVVVACSGKVEVGHIISILEQGIDGVQVIRCPDGECRFIDGNAKALDRVAHVRNLMENIGFGKKRVNMAVGDQLTQDDLFRLATAFGREVSLQGPNPMKNAQKDSVPKDA